MTLTLYVVIGVVMFVLLCLISGYTDESAFMGMGFVSLLAWPIILIIWLAIALNELGQKIRRSR